MLKKQEVADFAYDLSPKPASTIFIFLVRPFWSPFMADSPGKVLSSFTSTDKRTCISTKLNGCAGKFFQLLDRFNNKKSFPYKLLPSEALNHNTIRHTEEKLPMAKLLLIADENRVGSSRRDWDHVSDDACQKNEDCEERKEKKSVGVIARLMGLETMPSPEPFREKKHYEVLGNAKEAKSTRRLADSGPVRIKEAGKQAKAIDKKIKPTQRDQILEFEEKISDSSHVDQVWKFEAKLSALVTIADAPKQSTTKTTSKYHIVFQSSNTDSNMQLIEIKDAKVPFLSKLPPMPRIQVESPLKSILSPTSTLSKVLSPIKSPLTSKRTVCLFGAATKILEPSVRPARHKCLHPNSTKQPPQGTVGEDMNEQKMTLVGASSAPPLVQKAARSITSAKKRQLNLEGGGTLSASSSMVTECKSQEASRLMSSCSEKRAQSSFNEFNLLKNFISKQERMKPSLHVRHEKESTSKPISEKKMAMSGTQRQNASSFTIDGGRLKSCQKYKKSPSKGSQLNSKQNSAALPVLVKEEIEDQDEVSKRSNRVVISRRQGFRSLGPRSAKGSIISAVSHPSRTDMLLQGYKKSVKVPSELVNQNGGGRYIKASSQNADKVMSSHKSTTSSQSNIMKPAQHKGRALSIRPFAKRKSSSCLIKPLAQEDVITAAVEDFISDSPSEGAVEIFSGTSPCIKEAKSNFHQSDLDVSRGCSLDANNATNSTVAESVVHTRVRAKWDIGDERKRNITKSCITCQASDLLSADFHPGSNNSKAEYAMETPERAASILEELLLSLNTSTSQLCQDGSDAFLNEKKRSCRDLMDFFVTSSTALNCFLQKAEQRQQSYNICFQKADTSIKDTESVSDSLCAEEFEQPSPISILESPFQDSASSCSESCDTSHGRTESRMNASEVFDCTNSTGRHPEDPKIHSTETIPECTEFMDIMSCKHYVGFGSIEGDARMDMMTENDTIEATALSAILERFSHSGALLDSACFNLLKREAQCLLHRSAMQSKLSMENDLRVSPCMKGMCKRSTRHFGEFASHQRDLLFDGIEEAARLCSELAMQSYGFSALPMQLLQLPAAYILKRVYKQINEWKGLAVSMNLDDMMKMEINTGMGRWFKFGDEVDDLAENIEAMIVRSLIDELVEVVIGTPALCMFS